MSISLIPEDSRVRRFVATGGETVFPVSFPFFAASDLLVLRVRNGVTDTLLLASDYTVSGAGNQAGGAVTLMAPAQAGDVIVIVSAQPIARASEWQDGAALTARTLNAEIARWWIAAQQLRAAQTRMLSLPVTDPPTVTALPPLPQRANRLLGFDANGAPMPVSGNVIGNVLITGFGEALISQPDAAAARTLLDVPATADVLLRDGSQAMTGQLRAAGTSPPTAPALSFEGDADTGLRRSAADTLALAAGGVDRLTVGTAEIAAALPLAMGNNKIGGLADGTAAADAVTKGQLDAVDTVARAGVSSAVALTGSAVDITGLPAGIRQLWVVVRDANITSVSAHLFVQLGTSNGIETTGYDAHGHIVAGGGASVTSNAGFVFYRQSNATTIRAGALLLHRVSNTEWVATQTGSMTDGSTQSLIGGGGTKTLGDTLTQVRVTAGGSIFTSGTVSLLWRF